MALTVSFELRRDFTVDCSYEKVFRLLADVPKSVSHFPNVHRLVDIGDNSFRWEMEKLGVDKYSIQTIYACKYENDSESGWIKWHPVPGIGNGLVEGSWQIKCAADKTHVDFYTKGDLQLPLPSLAKFLITRFVVREFENLVDRYIRNLKKSFNKL